VDAVVLETDALRGGAVFSARQGLSSMALGLKSGRRAFRAIKETGMPGFTDQKGREAMYLSSHPRIVIEWVSMYSIYP
jgi:hypothetical protein